jgi:hypothetical protein
MHAILPKPATASFQAMNTLATAATGIIPFCEASGAPTEATHGATPSYSAGTPAIAAGSWGEARAFDLTIGTLTYPGCGLPGGTKAGTLAFAGNFPAPTTAQVAAGYSFFCPLESSQGNLAPLVAWTPPTWTIQGYLGGNPIPFTGGTFIPGHDVAVILTLDSITSGSDTLLALWIYDYTSNTATGPLTTHSGFPITIWTGAAGDLIINGNRSATNGILGTLSHAQMAGGSTPAALWTASQAAAFFTDPAAAVRAPTAVHARPRFLPHRSRVAPRLFRGR